MILQIFKKRAFFYFALFFFILITIGLFQVYNTQEAQEELEEIVLDLIEEQEEGSIFQPLLNPVAVVIDNYPGSINIAGLDQAVVVYELPTEGGSSRFLAIFDNNNGNEYIVGPVRSLRRYFIDYSLDLEALLVHCGGSPDALSKIASQRIMTLNEFYNHSYFKRNDKLKAPNNIYLKNSDWLRFMIDKDVSRQEISWLFDSETELDFTNSYQANEINTYYSQLYQANWQFDQDLKLYIRDPHNFKADNLIFHFVNARVVDELLRLQFNDEFEGRAVICRLGSCIDAQWKKEDIHRYYILGEEVLLPYGKTWVNILPNFAKLSF